MNSVWMVKEERLFDLSDVSRYGAIMPIFPKSVHPFDTAKMIDIIRSDVMPAASQWDFILNIGPTVMVSTFVATWVDRYTFARLLVWDAKAKQYNIVPVRMDPENDPLAERDRRRRAT